MSSVSYISGVIALLFVITWVTRSLPFVFGKWISQHEIFMMLGRQLPGAIIFMLLAYYVMMIAVPSHWHNLVWQIVALVVLLVLQWRYKKTIVSLLVGTAVYLVLQGIS